MKSRKHNFVLYGISVGLGASSFRISKFEMEETVHLYITEIIHDGVGWTHVTQDGSGNSATECMGFYGDSSLKTFVLLLH